MKFIHNKVAMIFLGVFLFSLAFGSGYYIGDSRDNFLGNDVSAEEPLNLEAFWKVYLLLEEKFVSPKDKEISDEDKVYGAIAGLVKSYGDPYTTFLPPKQNEQFEQTISGSFEGIGAEIGIEDGFLTVIAPLKNSPAEKGGVKAGDKIISIDETSASDLSVEEAIDLIRGKKGTKVKLTIIRKDEKNPITIEITRNTIVIPTIETKTVDDVFVINLYNFSANSSMDFRVALREFVKSKKNKLILDLRGNPGGYLESAIDITSWFLPAGRTVVIEDPGDESKQKKYRSRGYNLFPNSFKMVVLVDGGSASASEIVAGALQEYGVATLVGENTFGKGSVQELVDITDNTSLKLTIARWLTPQGKSISDGGLTPDVKVEFDSGKYEEGVDTQFQKAMEILKKK